MSETIEKRVVEMEFRNQEFEQNIKVSINSLDALKKALAIDRVTNGLDQLNKHFTKLDMEGVNSAISTVQYNFSAFGKATDVVLRRMINKALNVGQYLTNAFLFEPPKTGFQEYETQINAVQTILANTKHEGTTLEQVGHALDVLNLYADKTIYNFTEMTRNIGTFTAAGIGLNDSVSSIQGIANLAAISGSTSEQASRAMYQLSQALASGTVKLMDWNSVVNAGMGGKVFQDALLETARAHGIAVDSIIKKEGSFRESLSEGWLSADVLNETLAKFAGNLTLSDWIAKGYTEEQAKEIMELGKTASDAATKVKTFTQLMSTLKEAAQSGWTETWEIIVGDFEEAKNFLTMISDYFGAVIGKSSDSRNAILRDWKELGGRDSLIASIQNILKVFDNIGSGMKTALGPLMPVFNGETLYRFTKQIEKITAALVELTSADGFTGFFAKIRDLFTIDLSGTIFDPATGSMISDQFAEPFYEGTKRTVNFTAVLEIFKMVLGGLKRAAIPVLTLLADCLSALFYGIAEGARFITDLATSLAELLSSFSLSDGGKAFFDTVYALAFGIPNGLRVLFDALADSDRMLSSDTLIGKSLYAIGQSLASGFLRIHEALSPYVIDGRFDYAKAFGDLKAWFAGLFGLIEDSGQSAEQSTSVSVGEVVNTWIDQQIAALEHLKQTLIDAGRGFAAWFRDLGNGIVGELKSGVAWLDTLFNQTIPNFFSGVVTAITDPIYKLTNTDNMFDAIMRIYNVFRSVQWTRMLMGFVGFVNSFKGVNTTLTTTIASFGGLGGSLTKSVDDVGGLFRSLGDLARDIKENGFKKIIENKDSFGTTMLKLAGSIGILTVSVIALSRLDTKQAIKGFALVGLLLMEVGIITKITHSLTGDTAKSLLKLSGAILALSVVVGIVGSMNVEKALKGMTGIGLMLTTMALYTRIASKQNLGKAPFLSMAVSIGILTIVAKSIAKMSPTDIVVGLTAVGLMVTTMALYTRIASKMNVGKTPLIQLSVAVGLMSIALKSLSSMKFKEVMTGVTALGSILLLISLFTNSVKSFKSAALIGLALSLNMMVLAVKSLGAVETKSLVKGVSGITMLLGSMAKLTNNLSIVKSLVAFGMIVGTIQVFAYTVRQFDTIDTAKLVAVSFAMKFAIDAIGGIVKSLTKKKIGDPVKVGLGFASIMAAIVGVITIIGAIGELTNSDGASLFKRSGAMLKNIGKAMGQFVNGFISGVFDLNISSESVAKVVGSLSTLADNVGGSFLNLLKNVKGLDQENVKGMFAFAECIAIVAGAGIINGIASFVLKENAIDRFVRDISSLGDGITAFQAFTSSIGSLNTADTQNMRVYVKDLAETITDIIDGTSFLDLITGKGESAMNSFKTNMGTIGEALKTYGEKISGISKTASSADFNRANRAASALATLADKVPEDNGWLQKIVGYKDLGTFGQDIEGFADHMKAYATAIKGFDEGFDGDGHGKLLEIATAYTEISNTLPRKYGLKQALTGFSDLGLFSTELGFFVGGMETYAEKVNNFEGDLTDTKHDQLIKIVDGFAAVAKKIPANFGLMTILGSTSSLAVFGEEIGYFVDGMETYAEKVNAFGETGVSADNPHHQALIGTAESIIDLQGTMENNTGLLTWLGGFVDLGKFGDGLVNFAAGMASYAATIKGFAENAPSDADNAAVIATGTAITSVMESLPMVGGLISLFRGDRDLRGFSGDIRKLGEDLASFAMNVTTVNEGDGTKAVSVLTPIRDFINEMEVSGGIFDKISKWFGGSKENTLLSYTGVMAAIGDDLKTFTEGVTVAQVSDIGKAQTLFGKIDEFISGVNPEEWRHKNDIAPLTYYTEALGTMGDGLKHFHDGVTDIETTIAGTTGAMTILKTVKGFIDEINGVNSEGVVPPLPVESRFSLLLNNLRQTAGEIDYLHQIVGRYSNTNDTLTAATAIRTLAESVLMIGEMDGVFTKLKFQEFLDSVATADFTILNSINTESFGPVLQALATLVSSVATEGTNAGAELITSMINEITAHKTTVETAAADLAQNGVSGIRSTWLSWWYSGQYVASGFMSGIRSVSDQVIDTTASLARSVHSSFNRTLYINSPSRAFMESAMYCVQGLVRGFDTYGTDASQSIAGLAETMSYRAKGAMASLSAILAGEMDPTPTIRPVFDMSDVENGVLSMNRMFGRSPVLYAGGRSMMHAEAIESDINGRVYSRSDSRDIVNAIDELNVRMNEMTDTIGQMKIVLDSGTLVGGIAGEVNDQLGILAGRTERGN